MKPVLLLLVLLSAVLAAPAEDKLLPAETVEAQSAAAAAEEEEGGADSANPRYNFCPQFWFMYEGRCYKYFSSPKSWYNAEEQCNSFGGHLASVVSARQYSFLQQMMQTAGQSSVWLGGFYLQNRWLWINRDGFHYTNWYQHSSGTSYPCMFMYSNHGWANTQCTTNIPFICFKNPFGC
ncbi:snaclec coagulation factor IX/factor X-binding protein subunit B-like [Poeciliopsis prolifica]|uniref:snaclec coagulation factor IX/factor X-binding protein subunit B-like n=1 Tax=Poeciliopsis prolifica TaxID=188132 RepID=UPI002413E35E|nr:snaclec coagulation factor IX/factor X-binding protein subunit B-like [Poeciliopsis prolifica]XP_054876715.1 snaclec coagulation factor IX/factor X-binding protein subunit B-like [Poeciliopsis prolifica]XP_054876716.1 snaclec coagulation factor IX/factor X-binding protein subunit B-like [Poeciliopsis prolifica]XP_054876717.1 snaclec coagulation factor IX/factor X-binding protein subunit B-like [Poeciliopsis prolifica]